MYTRPFVPTHLLHGEPVQLTGWKDFRDASRVEYVTEHGSYTESRWCSESDLTPLDHEARPSDDPDSGDRCKDCGRPIVWTGPGANDWQHADDSPAVHMSAPILAEINGRTDVYMFTVVRKATADDYRGELPNVYIVRHDRFHGGEEFPAQLDPTTITED